MPPCADPLAAFLAAPVPGQRPPRPPPDAARARPGPGPRPAVASAAPAAARQVAINAVHYDAEPAPSAPVLPPPRLAVVLLQTFHSDAPFHLHHAAVPDDVRLLVLAPAQIARASTTTIDAGGTLDPALIPPGDAVIKAPFPAPARLFMPDSAVRMHTVYLPDDRPFAGADLDALLKRYVAHLHKTFPPSTQIALVNLALSPVDADELRKHRAVTEFCGKDDLLTILIDMLPAAQTNQLYNVFAHTLRAVAQYVHQFPSQSTTSSSKDPTTSRLTSRTFTTFCHLTSSPIAPGLLLAILVRFRVLCATGYNKRTTETAYHVDIDHLRQCQALVTDPGRLRLSNLLPTTVAPPMAVKRVPPKMPRGEITRGQLAYEVETVPDVLDAKKNAISVLTEYYSKKYTDPDGPRATEHPIDPPEPIPQLRAVFPTDPATRPFAHAYHLPDLDMTFSTPCAYANKKTAKAEAAKLALIGAGLVRLSPQLDKFARLIRDGEVVLLCGEEEKPGRVVGVGPRGETETAWVFPDPPVAAIRADEREVPALVQVMVATGASIDSWARSPSETPPARGSGASVDSWVRSPSIKNASVDAWAAAAQAPTSPPVADPWAQPHASGAALPETDTWTRPTAGRVPTPPLASDAWAMPVRSSDMIRASAPAYGGREDALDRDARDSGARGAWARLDPMVGPSARWSSTPMRADVVSNADRVAAWASTTSMHTDAVSHAAGHSASAATRWSSESVIATSVPPAAATAPTSAWASTAVPRTDLPAPPPTAAPAPAPVAAHPTHDATGPPPAATGSTGFDPSVNYVGKLTEYSSQHSVAMPTFEKIEATSTASPRFGCRVTYGPETHRETVASPVVHSKFKLAKQEGAYLACVRMRIVEGGGDVDQHAPGSSPPTTDTTRWPAHLASLPAWPASPVASLAARPASVASWAPSLGPAHLPARPPIPASFDDVPSPAVWGSATRASLPTAIDDATPATPVAACTSSLSIKPQRSRAPIPTSFEDTPPTTTSTPAAWSSSAPSVSLPPAALALIPTLLSSRADPFAALTQVAVAAGAPAPPRFATQSVAAPGGAVGYRGMCTCRELGIEGVVSRGVHERRDAAKRDAAEIAWRGVVARAAGMGGWSG
ncbi:hypothetical protein GGF32_000545 [Allomyces javanicus]|nr:hypothetical protein GGF32_000545 [Allomyces javanicus]